MNKRDHPVITVTPKAERSLRAGHPWVYFDEITADDQCSDGGLADVISQKGRYLGTGFYNSNSKIRVRILSDNANDRFDEAFFTRRLRYAVEYRRSVLSEDDFRCCRLIFGESDGLPGLTVDRFEDVLVAQTLSLGVEQRKSMIFNALIGILRSFGAQINVLYERTDVSIRELEGIQTGKGFFCADGLIGESDGHCIITENGIKYDVDYINGQKTGFFLDQKYNRAAAAKIARGRKVLDCFTHTGSFALNCAAAGAERVTAVDVSHDALIQAQKNAELNSLTDRIEFKQANVFELLTEMSEKGHSDFDFIILDPPAFTKSSRTAANAARGYKEINLKAMRLLPRGGYLATCSCSHFMTDGMFKKMLHDAAADANVRLRQIAALQQSPDHPILWNVPETDYLKFYLFQVV